MEKWEREHIRDLARRKLDLAGTPHKTGISANRGAPFNHTRRDRKHMAAITGSGKTVRGLPLSRLRNNSELYDIRVIL